MPLTLVARGRLQTTLACAGTLLLAWRIQNPVTLALPALAFVLAALAWISPARYAPVQRAFERAGRWLLAGFTWFALGVIYFGLLTPIAIWRRLARVDPLQIRGDKSPSGTCLHRTAAPRSDHFERQF